MLNVKYEICIEISCKNWSKIFFAVLSLGSDKKIDKIGTGVFAACLHPRARQVKFNKIGTGVFLVQYNNKILWYTIR